MVAGLSRAVSPRGILAALLNELFGSALLISPPSLPFMGVGLVGVRLEAANVGGWEGG